MRVFDIDNPVMRLITKVFDCFLLSILWLIFSLPVITCGAASAAMYTTVYKYLRVEEGTLWGTFWKAFRENFKQSTLVWLVALGVQALLAADALVFRALYLQGKFMGNLYWLSLILCCIALTWVAFMTAYSARFNGSVKDTLKFGVLLMALHPLRAVEVLAVILAELAIIITAPVLVAVAPAASCWVSSIFIEKVFLLHMSDEDAEKTRAEEATRKEGWHD